MYVNQTCRIPLKIESGILNGTFADSFHIFASIFHVFTDKRFINVDTNIEFAEFLTNIFYDC